MRTQPRFPYSPPTDKWREWLYVAGVSLVLLLLVFLRTERMTLDHPHFALPMDHHKYILMATQGPWDFHIAPYCWRIATPLLAGVMPFDLQTNFLLITLASLWLTGITLYYLARRFDLPRDVALMAPLLFFSLGWATKFVVYDFWLADAWSGLMLAATIWAIRARKDALYVVLLVLGVLVKEPLMCVPPLYYTLHTRRWLDLRLAGRALVLALPAVATFVAVRLAIPNLNNDPAYLATLPLSLRLVRTWAGDEYYSSYWDYAWMIRTIGLPQWRDVSVQQLVAWTVGTYGALISLLCLASRRNAELFLRFLPFLLLIYAQTLLTTPGERILVIGFPALIVLALHGVAALSQRLGLAPPLFYPLPLLFLALHLGKSSGGFSELEPVELGLCAGYLLALLGLRAMGRKRQNQTPSPSAP